MTFFCKILSFTPSYSLVLPNFFLYSKTFFCKYSILKFWHLTHSIEVRSPSLCYEFSFFLFHIIKLTTPIKNKTYFLENLINSTETSFMALVRARKWRFKVTLFEFGITLTLRWTSPYRTGFRRTGRTRHCQADQSEVAQYAMWGVIIG